MIKPDGSVKINNVTSSPDGNFLLTLKLDMEGKWRFTAEYPSNSSYEHSVSGEAKAIATARPTMPIETIISLIVIAVAIIMAMVIIKRRK